MISTRHLVRRIALTALVAGACSAAQAQGESATSIYNQSGLDGSSFVLSGTLATVQREGSESEAYLTLPPADWDSRMTQLVEQHYAEVDYRLKVQAKSFWDTLASLQEVRRDRRDARSKSAQ